MTLTLVVRDALETLGQDPRGWWFYVETSFQSFFQYLFGAGWARQLTELPILAPELAAARSGGFQIPIQQWANPTGPAFTSGFLNAIFLGLPISLSHLLAFRRYALHGLPSGWTATFGYRVGEVLAIQVRAVGGTVWWGYQAWEPLPLLVGLVLTAFVVRDAVRGRVDGLVRIGFLHFAYAWVEQGVLLGTLGGQTLDLAAQSARIYVGPGSFLLHLSYGRGLLLGGLLMDALLLSGALFGTERLLFLLRCPPEAWRRTVDQWSNRLRVGLAIATIPFYTADYLRRGPLGFSSRDTDLSRRLSRLAFSVPMPRPNEPVSVQFEGRNVLTPDSYGRTAPDVVRDPWHRAQLSVEAVRDGIEETYATRTSNQRVDAVYLGSLERAVFEWLNRRGRESVGRETIPRAEPVRLGLGRETAPAATVVGDADRRASRLERWYRAARGRRSDSYARNLPLERSQGHPDGLTALYHTGLESPRYLAGGGLVEPFRAVRYDSPAELSRKRNARRSPLHRAPVHLYRDWLLSRQPKEYLTTAYQQRGLYRARLALGDYLSACRRYAEAERGPRGWEVNRRVSSRGVWQRELLARTLGGIRSRASSVYSQQYSGNLHLVRRLFAVSWDPRENRTPVVRRKLALDQRTLQRPGVRFEHEELGRADQLKVTNGENRLLAPGATPGKAPNGQWVLLPGGVSRPDRQVRSQPLYAGWDTERRALVLCNRYLPAEQAIQAGAVGPIQVDRFNTARARALADQRMVAGLRSGSTERLRFTVWPRTARARRRRATTSRYSARVLLSRRMPARDVALLGRDRARWARGAAGSPSISQFAFWLNPRSEARRNPQDLTPTRSAQSFPLAFERTARVGAYSPGDLQPSNRGGFVWPGGDRRIWSAPNSYRPGAPRDPPVNASLFQMNLLSVGGLTNLAFFFLLLQAVYRRARPRLLPAGKASRTGPWFDFPPIRLLAGSLRIRWYSSQHFPISNLYESLVFLSLLLRVGVTLLQTRQVGPVVVGLASLCPLLVLGFASFSLPPELQAQGALVPALKSNWLLRHVTVRILSYAALRLGSLLSVVYLALLRYQPRERLDELSYRLIGFGFPFLTLGILSGAVWANETWGSYWSWDPKETWSLITWLVFAVYLHSRLVKGEKGETPAKVAALGFVLVWVCYLGVNLVGKGLHSYGFVFPS